MFNKNVLHGTRLIIIAVTALCVSVTACKKDICTVYVDHDTNNRKVTVEEGDSFRICLSAQLSTGFAWKIKNKSENIAVLGEPVIHEQEPEADVTGRPEKQVFTLKTTSAGDGFIEFVYTQDWRQPSQDDRVVRIDIKAE